MSVEFSPAIELTRVQSPLTFVTIGKVKKQFVLTISVCQTYSLLFFVKKSFAKLENARESV